jgi:hypothetical protein
MCCFATGILLILRLRKLEHQINFHHLDPDVRNAWWDIPLTEMMTYEEESKQMHAILKAADIVDYAKVTHHCLQCVQYGMSRGLMEQQISTITKHVLTKQATSYAPEVEEETMKVMSGFRKHETRFVKLEYIRLGPDHDKCVQIF